MNLTISEKRKSAISLPDKNGEAEIFYPESDGKPVAETQIHINTIFNLYEALRNHFSGETDTAVIADMMFYYEKNNPRKFIAPDVMVIRGVGKHPRRVFKLWEERPPDVVFEISSRGTWKEDLQKKHLLYQSFGVKEYYVFDPEYDYLRDEPLIAYHLKKGLFEKVKVKGGRIFSPALKLEITDTGETLRLFNPDTENFLPTIEELAGEAAKAKILEAENKKLKAELAKLKRQN